MGETPPAARPRAAACARPWALPPLPGLSPPTNPPVPKAIPVGERFVPWDVLSPSQALFGSCCSRWFSLPSSTLGETQPCNNVTRRSGSSASWFHTILIISGSDRNKINPTYCCNLSRKKGHLEVCVGLAELKSVTSHTQRRGFSWVG